MISISADRRGRPALARGLRAAIVTIATAALIAGCGGGAGGGGAVPKDPSSGASSSSQGGAFGPLPDAPSDGKTRVALLLPMTGQYSELGTAMRRAAEMALFDAASDQFELTPIDTQGTPDGASRAFSRAMQQDALLILGPLFSTSARAIKSRVTEEGIPAVAFSNDRTVAGNGLYVMGFLPQQQVDRVVSYTASQGMTRFAALAPDTPHGRDIVGHLQQSAAEAGGTVTRTSFYPPEQADVSETVQAFAGYGGRQAALEAEKRRLRNSGSAEDRARLSRLRNVDTLGEVPYDAVLLPEGGTKLQIVASLLAYYDVDPDEVQFLGTGQWDDPLVPREPMLHGGWFAAPPAEARTRFEERYSQSYGNRPPRLATLAYDAVAMAATLSRKSPDGLVTHEMITDPEGFYGLDGLFRFGRDGLNERGLSVLEVQRGGFQPISPAPQRFPAGQPAS